MCQQLAREGASVAVAGNNLSDCEETVSTIRAESGSFDASFHPVEVDVSDSHQVSRLFSSIASKFTGNPTSRQWETYYNDPTYRLTNLAKVWPTPPF